jgi:pilus assembly protein Flp/PilA
LFVHLVTNRGLRIDLAEIAPLSSQRKIDKISDMLRSRSYLGNEERYELRCLRERIRVEAEAGQGMIEYGLLVALISIVALVVITAIGGGLTGVFQSVMNAV